MSLEENKAIARRHFEELWGKGALDVADEIYSPKAIGHNSINPDQTHYPDSEKQNVANELTAFPDAVITVEDQIAERDRVVTRWSMDATHTGPLYGIPATGKTVRAIGMHVHRFEDGKIVEVWGFGDFMGLMRQLELVQI